MPALLLLASLKKEKLPEDDRTKREKEDYSSGKKIPHTSEPHRGEALCIRRLVEENIDLQYFFLLALTDD